MCVNEFLQVDLLVIILGDFNVIFMEIDVYKLEYWMCDVLYFLEICVVYQCLLNSGWYDVIRILYFEECIYIFWEYFCNLFVCNVGICIDYFLVNDVVMELVKSCGVDCQV